MGKPIGNHAIVIGASIAGLLAGRVLSKHFEKVTILERDILPSEPVFRRGVPQGHHLHIVMIRGQQILNHYFPTLAAELDAANVPVLNWLKDFRMEFAKGSLPQVDIGLQTRSCSRPRLEWIIRRELGAFSNINFVENCSVENLMFDGECKKVVGVEIRHLGGLESAPQSSESLLADFVLDASGRDSRTPKWLEGAGLTPPAESIVNAYLGYTSRAYSKLSFPVDWKSLVIASIPPDQPRGGVIALLENNQWLVLLSGAEKQPPPKDHESFLSYAKSLSSPLLYEAVKDGEPSSEIYPYRRTANTMRHYENLTNFPERLVIMGDAVCCFNPVYGQGITISALGAETLDHSLGQTTTLDGFGKAFQAKLAKTNQLPWLMATGADLQYPTTESNQPSKSNRLVQNYLWRLQELMPRSADVAKSFLEVLNMVSSPSSLFHPRLVLQVLRDMF